MGCQVEDSTHWVDHGDFEGCVAKFMEHEPPDPFGEKVGRSDAGVDNTDSSLLDQASQALVLYDPGSQARAAVGIAFGANAHLALFESGTPIAVPDRGGYKSIPAIVAIRESGKRVVGRNALRDAIPNAENTASNLHRIIGRKWGSPQTENVRLVSSCAIVEGADGMPNIMIGGKLFTVQTLVSYVFAELKRIADDYTQSAPLKAVIAVPAYFNDAQRKAMTAAAELSNIEVLGVLNEPSAACLAYDFLDTKMFVAVYDLSGATFDISVLQITPPERIDIVSTTGDTFLGGEDFDARVVEWLIEQLPKEQRALVSSDRLALQRLRDAAERAKCALSHEEETDIELPFLLAEGLQQHHLRCTLTRAEFEAMTTDLLDRTIDICKTALADAKLEMGAIDRVILTGGMTNMPAVQRRVQALFKKRLSKNLLPEHAVAFGAARQAAAILHKQHLVGEATSADFAVVPRGRTSERVFARGTALPARHTKTFAISQSRLDLLLILDPSAPKARKLLAEFTVRAAEGSNPPDTVQVAFEIDAHGVVTATAIEQSASRFRISSVSLLHINVDEELAISMEYGIGR
jgi:molecular chaperone DnaK